MTRPCALWGSAGCTFYRLRGAARTAMHARCLRDHRESMAHDRWEHAQDRAERGVGCPELADKLYREWSALRQGGAK